MSGEDAKLWRYLFYVAVIIKTLNCVGCVVNRPSSLKAGVKACVVFLT